MNFARSLAAAVHQVKMYIFVIGYMYNYYHMSSNWKRAKQYINAKNMWRKMPTNKHTPTHSERRKKSINWHFKKRTRLNLTQLPCSVIVVIAIVAFQMAAHNHNEIHKSRRYGAFDALLLHYFFFFLHLLRPAAFDRINNNRIHVW